MIRRFRQEVDVQVNCDHSLLVKNCKFNTLALIFASIRYVLFICWYFSTWNFKTGLTKLDSP